MCGENFDFHLPHLLPPGSSPRVRGKRNIGPSKTLKAGLIPACAGKTHSSSLNRFSTRAHPRVCGENFHVSRIAPPATGSSPRVRGKPELVEAYQVESGLIPACAGKTLALFVMRSHVRAHPRVCGENAAFALMKTSALGSSPRVRGKRAPACGQRSHLGLIPACAGKTDAAGPARADRAAHPRVCGENGQRRSRRRLQQGSSPRVRGKRRVQTFSSRRLRLIPACAGKT